MRRHRSVFALLRCYPSASAPTRARPPLPNAPGKRAQLGLRYSSPYGSAGAILQPATNSLSSLWLVGRREGVTGKAGSTSSRLPFFAPCPRCWRLLSLTHHLRSILISLPLPRIHPHHAAGIQISPNLPLDAPTPALNAAFDQSGSAMDWLRSVSSVALAYSPDGGRGRASRTRGGQPMFTAAMEMVEGRTFIVSFFQHMAAVRQVFNPIESDDVIGITNYIDVGMQLQVRG
jgi:hypothetical protein